MERKYFYARTVGSREAAVQKITSTVLDANMASEIPLVKLERKDRGEFYVFLGVESEDTHGIPGGVGQTLRSLGLRFNENDPLLPDQIRTMVQREDIEIHGFNVLRYRQREYMDPGDPFDQPEFGTPETAPPGSSARMERLLHWLSSRGEGTWAGFKQVCDLLKVASDTQEARSVEARSVLRRFVLLGHLDLSPDGFRWAASPPALVRFPENPDCGFLSGRRTEATLKSMKQVWPLTETPHLHYSGPPRFSLVPVGDVSGTGFQLTDGGVTSSRLATLLPDLNGWMDSLQSIEGLALSLLHIERWESGGFVPCDTLYERNGVYNGESGMYRIRHEGNRSERALTLYFDEPNQRWLRGDWYGLRFLSLSASKSGKEAVHQSDTGVLSIPASQRWPLLYEKALILASGMLPERGVNPNWLEYANISSSLTKELCGKLEVDLKEN